MAIISKKNNNNTNANTSGSFFPKSDVKSTGEGYTNQNRAIGSNIKGKIKALRPLKSAKNPTVFAVIDIEVPGQFGVFQDFLNFSAEKPEQSMSYLVNHTKAILASAGLEDTEEDAEKDMDWVESALKALAEGHYVVNFNQEQTPRGLDITYNPAN